MKAPPVEVGRSSAAVGAADEDRDLARAARGRGGVVVERPPPVRSAVKAAAATAASALASPLRIALNQSVDALTGGPS